MQEQGAGAEPVAADPLMVTMVFDAIDPDAFAADLSRYVVLSRSHEGCVNIDLAASATTPGRFVIISKWATTEAQRAHMDSPELVELAEASRSMLATPAAIDLLEPISAHDLH